MALVVTQSPSSDSIWRDPATTRLNMDSKADLGIVPVPTPVSVSSIPVSVSSSSAGGGGADLDDNVIVKDEHGQDINCVVCGDKSSGKHYGQYTCEGTNHAAALTCQESVTLLILPYYSLFKFSGINWI